MLIIVRNFIVLLSEITLTRYMPAINLDLSLDQYKSENVLKHYHDQIVIFIVIIHVLLVNFKIRQRRLTFSSIRAFTVTYFQLR